MIELNPFVIFFAAIFTNNMIFSNFLGMCSFIAVSREIPTSLGLGQAVTFVLACTTIINYLIYHYVLLPLHLEYLRFIVFIISIAAFVQLLEMIVERYLPNLYYALGIFLPLITVNCAILGVSLFMIIRNYNLLQSIGFSIGSGIGWTLAIVALAGIRQKMKKASVPKGLEGPGITLIITGLMALAFIGFSGIVQIQ
ncbi:NADH:ubiquinone reductase (Na(+)-transporting) subunit E [Tissierella praeacuta]|uniref:Ion-translocating oxidoreductase complex subunit A n=1 Tax=Tissierella praeacuta DSM 18095 TaxID=1123404 RepID=A0A1M4S4L9_9FIRM|nr:Rnf-Nqr domain containing protein [Tissierella praeacuta]TCU71567.1 Na+-transporting NADH:ubiquinone oxidoreductase subunit E [Tissierella praeacuta]SHE27154.1 Na+-transporting NADH:ubiquinone oxidoreductase subunit E [Tissierella praeacuta DSM 18095]SUP00816.1 Na(+)-translocating NADH-quinone reductase subunit E [Tissierella praeacuta]